MFARPGRARTRRVEAVVVPCRLEQRQRLPSEPLQLVGRALAILNRACAATDAGERRVDGSSPSAAARSAAASAIAAARARSVQSRAFASSTSRRTSNRCGRVSESARSSSPVAVRQSPRQSARWPADASRSPAAQCDPRSGWPSSSQVARRLLEVVAERSRPARRGSRRAPRASREALVQLGAGRLRQGLVGGVADQEVAEAERVLARKLWPVGTDELAADERRQPRRDLPFPPARAPGRRRRWKSSPSTAPRSSTFRSGSSSWSSRAAEQRAQRRRTPRPRHRSGCHRDHLRQEERVAAGGADDPLAAARPRRRRREQRWPSSSRSGSSRSVAGQRGTALEQLRPRHAEEQRAARRSRAALSTRRGRGTSPPPTGCRRSRRRAAPAPRAACGTPRRSPRRSTPCRSRRAASGSPPPPAGSRRQGVQLLHAPRRPASR